jgi:hypothetical protein
VERLVFLPTDQEAAQRPPSSRPLRALLLLTVLAVAWWLFVPPIVHRPSAPVWCPSAITERPTTRFDAREVLGKSLSDGYQLAARHGCVVQDASASHTDELRTNRISVEISRGTITRIEGIH